MQQYDIGEELAGLRLHEKMQQTPSHRAKQQS